MSNSFDISIKSHGVRLGIEVIDNYERYDKKMRFNAIEGEYKGLTGYIDYTGLRRSKSLSYNSLTEDSKKEYQDRVALCKNCTIISYADNYTVNNPMIVKSFLGVTYTTTFTELKRRKPFGLVSHGEHMVYNVLTKHNVDFIRQYRVTTAIGSQFFDFYLPAHDVYIEYQGVQHYKETNYFSKTLVEQQEYDEEKRRYVHSLGAKLIEIPYTEDTEEKIESVLSKVVAWDCYTKDDELQQVPLTADNIVNYYKSHTRKETANKFNISESSVTKIAKDSEFVKRGKRPKNYSDDDVLDLYIHKDLNREHVAETLGISVNTVSNVARRYGYKKVPSRAGVRLLKD